MDAGIPQIAPARTVPPPRRPGPVARIGLGLLLLAITTVATASAWRSYRGSGGCEPQSWADWHLAMKQECLTPAYVCENMTPAKLLDDPQLREAFRRSFEAGEPSPLRGLEALVGQMRAEFGCEGGGAPGSHAAPPPHPRLPPGHPPIDGHGPRARPHSPVIEEPGTLDI